MGFGIKIYFIEQDDKIVKIPLSRFEKIRKKNAQESFPEYKNTKIRYAEVVIEFENKKPITINRAYYGYLKFDSEGKIDQIFYNEEMNSAREIMPTLSFRRYNVINARDQFAKKVFKDNFQWSPSDELEKKIRMNIFRGIDRSN